MARQPPTLTGTLWCAALVRSLAAVALATSLVLRDPASAADVARASVAYWIVDGVVTLWTVRIVTPGLGWMLFVLRGGIAISAGVIILGLPLEMVFGSWRPAQVLVLLWSAVLVLTLSAFQFAASAVDAVVSRQIRRHLRSEWSWTSGAAFSAFLALAVAATFVAPASLLGRVVAGTAILAALALVVGIARLHPLRRHAQWESSPRF